MKRQFDEPLNQLAFHVPPNPHSQTTVSANSNNTGPHGIGSISPGHQQPHQQPSHHGLGPQFTSPHSQIPSIHHSHSQHHVSSVNSAISNTTTTIQASPCKRLNPITPSINRRFSKKPRLGGYIDTATAADAFAEDLLSAAADGFAYNAVAICDSFAEGSHRADDFFGPHSGSADFEGCADRNSEPGTPIALRPPQELKPPASSSLSNRSPVAINNCISERSNSSNICQQISQPTQPQAAPLEQAQPKTASEAPQPKELLVDRSSPSNSNATATSPNTSSNMRSKPEPERLIAETKMDIDMDEDDRPHSAFSANGGGDESPEPPTMSRPFPCIWLDSSQEPLRCKDATQVNEALKVHTLHTAMVTSSDMRNGSDGVAHETGSQPSDDETHHHHRQEQQQLQQRRESHSRDGASTPPTSASSHSSAGSALESPTLSSSASISSQHRSAMEHAQSMPPHHTMQMERSPMERSTRADLERSHHQQMERSASHMQERSQMERSPLERSPMDRLDRSPLERSPLERSQHQQQQQQHHQQHQQQQHSPPISTSQSQQHLPPQHAQQPMYPQRSPLPHDAHQDGPPGPSLHPPPPHLAAGGGGSVGAPPHHPHGPPPHGVPGMGQQNGFPAMKEGLTPSPLKNGLSSVAAHHQFLNGLPPEGTTVVGPDGEQLTLEVCPECNKVFKRRVYLQRHMEREHWSTAKVFKCSDCSYETKHQSNLSVHRRIHTGERPYNCGACGQTYTQGHLLKSHIRSRHGGNMEFYNLDKSNSERPYHCGACGQRYTQGHLLKSHIRSRHEGNMEFYNLDKKGESTRGRKSLDPKHDPAAMMQQKQEKINSLVAQIERQKMSQMMGGGSANMASFLGANMPPYMNAALRPFMASPLALGNNLMGGPRLFAIGNMQNMNNNMIPIQPGMSMLSHGALAAMSMEGAGIKVPLKVPEVPSPVSFNEVSGPKITVIDDSIPQDLTTKKTPPLRSPPLRSPTSAKSPSSVLREVNGSTTPNGNAFATGNVNANGSGNKYFNNFHNNIHHKDDHTDDIAAAKERHYNGSSPVSASMVDADGSQLPPIRNAIKELKEMKEMSKEMKEEIPPSRMLDDSSKKEAAMDFTCNGTNHKNCDHAEKLRALRKNIVRMLSVLTPDLGVENTLDYDSDQVDELLHEVIYSNIEEEVGDTSNAIKT